MQLSCPILAGVQPGPGISPSQSHQTGSMASGAGPAQSAQSVQAPRFVAAQQDSHRDSRDKDIRATRAEGSRVAVVGIIRVRWVRLVKHSRDRPFRVVHMQ